MRARLAAGGAVGVLATLLACVVLFAPGAVERVRPLARAADALAAGNLRHLLLAVGAFVSLGLSAAGWRASGAGGDGDGFGAALGSAPEDVTAARQRLTAAGLAGAFDDAAAGDADAVDRVRDRLREAAARAYARSTGCGDDAATEAVRDGSWTDDRTAAAVLADADGPTHSVRSRLRLWLDPAGERRRRIERTVRAMEALAGGEP